MGVADVVVQILEAQEWPVDTDDLASGMVRTAIRTPATTFAGAAVVEESQGQLVFYAVRPDTVPDDRVRDVVELITRANARFAVGSLELDLDAGQLRARTSLDMGAEPVPDEIVERLVDNTLRVAVVIAHQWFPVVDDLVAGELTVAQAFARATGQ